MQGPARFIYPAILSGIMAFLMTAVVTALNVGLPPDFLARWGKAFVIAWPCAYGAALIAGPFARRGTAYIVSRLEGPAP
jgi:hypothetical protein